MIEKKKFWKWGDHERMKEEGDKEPDAPKERPGICFHCGHGNFDLKLVKRQIHRVCKQCGSQLNAETGEIVKEGNS